MNRISIKSERDIEIMTAGGEILARIREATAQAAKAGVTTKSLDDVAQKMIDQSGGEASFKKVPGYHHATCINVDEVVVHGIPAARKLTAGSIVGIDVGLYLDGFHTDAAITVAVEGTKEQNLKNKQFLEVGRRALKKAIEQAKPGKRIWDISQAMQEVIEAASYSPVKALTGHGVGRELHEEPAIPCFVMGKRENSPTIVPGMVLAIEVMYNEGVSDVAYINNDGWTIATMDGKMSGLFEETVAITKDGPKVLTKAKNE